MLLCPELTCPGTGKHPLTRIYRPLMRTLGSEEQRDCSPLLRLQLDTTCPTSQSKELSRVFYSTTTGEHWFFGAQRSLGPTLTSLHDYWENHSFDYTDLCQQRDTSAVSTLECSFNMLMGSCLPLPESLRWKPQFFLEAHGPCLLLPPFLPQPPHLLQPLWLPLCSPSNQARAQPGVHLLFPLPAVLQALSCGFWITGSSQSGLDFNAASSKGPPPASFLKESHALWLPVCLFLLHPLSPLQSSSIFTGWLSNLLLHHHYLP